MKSIILKKMMPFAVFVLGILGAFTTTSMQSAKAANSPVLGYVAIPGNPCAIEVDCSDVEGEACRQFEDSGPEAHAMDKDSETSCTEQAYRP